ncbi:hypothetical protein ACI68E_003111 [Malassezia pachydermatis]|uniref:Uncharacterized protein n=1 Tax=Malassezia pachydermatis TaxID=77020 RepID=A0A0M9VPG9_9BASI|nr:hypothetical protein Malapachy_3909 [Malassezia pachydermatis]KOS14443.1 hypothetical protein Malapachy_3909 [Malassezia pachydermatis]
MHFLRVVRRPPKSHVRCLARALSTGSEPTAWATALEAAPAPEAPTLDALDALRPNPPVRSSKHTEASQWSKAYDRVNDAFTRPQLYRLAKEADIKGVRSSTPKAQLVKAVLQHRFALTDPTIKAKQACEFVPFPLSHVFLLAQQGAPLFQVARDAGASVTISKNGTAMGVSITGSTAAIEHVKAWLHTFEASIHTAKMQGTVPPFMLPWLSRQTKCHVASEENTLRLTYVDPRTADDVHMLVTQQAHTAPLSWRDVWCYGVNRATAVTNLPFVPGSVADAATHYAITQGTYSRWMHEPSNDDPSALYDVAHATPCDISTMKDIVQTQASSLDPLLCCDTGVTKLRLSFGHLLWQSMPRTTQPLTTPHTHTGVFVEACPPSCMRRVPTIPGWTELEMDEATWERFYYRLPSPSGTHDLVLTYAVHEHGKTFHSAMWQSTLDTYVACPTVSVDARVTAVWEAPASMERLRETALRTYLDSTTESSQADMLPPQVLELRLSDNVMAQARLWRTEHVVQRSSTLFHTTEQEELVLSRDATRRPTMPYHVPIVSWTWSAWPHDPLSVLRAVVQPAYKALGRQTEEHRL